MNKTLNLIFGLCSLLGLIVTLVSLNNTLNDLEIITEQTVTYKNLVAIYKVLGVSIIALIVLFLFQSFYFNANVSNLQRKLGELPIENQNLIEYANYYIRINKSTTNSIHNITHSYRYIYILLRDIVIELRKNDSTTTEADCRKTCNEVEKYLLSLLSNITSTVNVITQDECAACIKIFKNNKVKTLYRDPDSYRYRKNSDFTQKGQINIYKAENNFAFELIADKASKETFFVCDDLEAHEKYFNINHEWNKLYNATIVVPIQANLSGNKRKKEMRILAFLCCDNTAGGFENKEMKDFLSATGDLLFNLFHLYDRFAQLAKEKGFTNETLREYDYWGDSGQV